MKPVILVTAPYSTTSLELVRIKLDAKISMSKNTQPQKEELAEVEGLLIRSTTKVDKNLLAWAPKLKVIVTATAGYDHIDLVACEQQKVAVMFCPEANRESAAQLTLGLLLDLARGLTSSNKALLSRQWRDPLPRGFELGQQTFGILGLGRVGSRVAELVQALGLKVIAHDPYIDQARFKQFNVTPVGLNELFYQSNILSLHVPLTKETKHLVNGRTLKMLCTDSYLINTSRGPVVHEDELLKALEQNHLAGAALDVFEIEPLANESRLRGCDKIIMTPHIGAHTQEAFEKASIEATTRLVEFFTDFQRPKSFRLRP